MDNAVDRRPGRSCAGFRFLQRHTDFRSLIGSSFDDKSSIKSCGALTDMAQSHAGSIDLGLTGLAKDKTNAVVGHFKCHDTAVALQPHDDIAVPRNV